MKDRRIGIFTIDRQYIDGDPKGARAALEGVIVIRAETLFWKNAIEYVGIHDDFDECEIGAEPPRYIGEMQQLEDGTVRRNRWIKQETP